MGLRSFLSEWKARRAGRKSMERTDLSRAAREVVGPTGWMWSRGWDAMNKGKEAYVKSFDKRLPPSLFVSERDRTRQNIPVPLVERMIAEEHGKTTDSDSSPAE